MNTVTVADIGRRPGATLSSSVPSIVTNNGKPQNLIVNVDGMGIDEVVELARSMQAKAALATMRKRARSNGLQDMSMEDIDAEIDSVREQQ